MSNENNKMQVDIENLIKQNVNDLSSIKELYRKLKEVEEKITQIKYIDINLANKLKKEYENLKKIILDENIQAKLANDIETINSQLDTNILQINSTWINLVYPPYPLKGLKCNKNIDDYEAFQKIIDTVPSGSTLFLPSGCVSYISKGLIVKDKNILLLGHNTGFDRLQRLRTDLESQLYPLRESDSCIKFMSGVSNDTMLTVKWTKGEVDKRPVVTIRDLAFDGSDGSFSRPKTVSTGRSKDLIIKFETTNCNGVSFEESNLCDMENCFFIGFSGYAYSTGVWNKVKNCVSQLCGVGAILGTDATIQSPMIQFCRDGLQIGKSNMPANISRALDIRIEWCEDYGVRIIRGSNITVTGKIDRTGYSGIISGIDGYDNWVLNIDLQISRGGCYMQNLTIDDITEEEYKLSTNYHFEKSYNSNIKILSIMGTSDDVGGYQAPAFGGYIKNTQNIILSIVKSGNFNDSEHPLLKTYGVNYATVDEDGKHYYLDMVGKRLMYIDNKNKKITTSDDSQSIFYGDVVLGKEVRLPLKNNDTTSDTFRGAFFYNTTEKMPKLYDSTPLTGSKYATIPTITKISVGEQPTFSATGVGQFVVNVITKKVYFSVATGGGESDWVCLN